MHPPYQPPYERNKLCPHSLPFSSPPPELTVTACLELLWERAASWYCWKWEAVVLHRSEGWDMVLVILGKGVDVNWMHRR
jgi:hypothetical protein